MDINQCFACGRVFAQKSSLTRHTKARCPKVAALQQYKPILRSQPQPHFENRLQQLEERIRQLEAQQTKMKSLAQLDMTSYHKNDV